ncbi:MAG: hypothetical protein ABIH24_03855 [Verrucomicrobiota bacterium]
MMIRCFAWVPFLALNLLFAGCACIPGGIAASNTPLHAKPYTVIGDTEGRDSHYAILGLIPVTSGNSLKDAVKKAKGRVGADALIDITVDSYTQWWILFTRTVTEVYAKGIRFKDAWEGDNEIKR